MTDNKQEKHEAPEIDDNSWLECSEKLIKDGVFTPTSINTEDNMIGNLTRILVMAYSYGKFEICSDIITQVTEVDTEDVDGLDDFMVSLVDYLGGRLNEASPIINQFAEDERD